MTKAIQFILIGLFAVSCNSVSQKEMATEILIQESINTISNLSAGQLHYVEAGYLESPERAKKYYDQAMSVKSQVDSFDALLNELEKKSKNVTFSQIENSYLALCDSIESVLIRFENEFEIPKLDNSELSGRLKLLSMQLDIHNRTLYLYDYLGDFTYGVHFRCWFSLITGQEKTINENQFSLVFQSPLLNHLEKNFIIIDSAFSNNQSVTLDFDAEPRYDFKKITIDSLKNGNYKIYGTVYGFEGTRKYSERFEEEFTINSNVNNHD